ncbi:unnamed protein product [Amoebophrya sp. A25]|nr:unnamed protein product [Amoebophrya sp. A25]|eukprot:GSA25T00008849001.1
MSRSNLSCRGYAAPLRSSLFCINERTDACICSCTIHYKYNVSMLMLVDQVDELASQKFLTLLLWLCHKNVILSNSKIYSLLFTKLREEPTVVRMNYSEKCRPKHQKKGMKQGDPNE